MESYIRTKSSVNFRKGPSTADPIITKLAKGTIVQTMHKVSNSTWYCGKLADGTLGYISGSAEYVENFEPLWLSKAKALIAVGEKYLGVPYQFNSSRKTDTTFDCSDFVKWIYSEALGITLPSNSRDQSAVGMPNGTSFDVLRTGDLLFFDTNNDGIINHVGIYVADNLMLHTASTTGDVLNRDLSVVRKGGGGVTYVKYDEGTFHRGKTTGSRRIPL